MRCRRVCLSSLNRARVQIDQSGPPDAPKRVIIMGDPQCVALASEMIKAVTESGPSGMNSVLVNPGGAHGNPDEPVSVCERWPG